MVPGEIIFWIMVIGGASGCLIWMAIDNIRSYLERKKISKEESIRVKGSKGE